MTPWNKSFSLELSGRLPAAIHPALRSVAVRSVAVKAWGSFPGRQERHRCGPGAPADGAPEGRVVSPRIHALASLAPQNVTAVGAGAFTEVIQVN